MAVEQSISSSPVRQALFIQEKLEKIYKWTHEFLGSYRKPIEVFQDVLVWKKPVASAMMYIVIHWIFVIYVKTNASMVTIIGNIVFWVLLGDVLWRAATKDGFSGNNKLNRRGSNVSVGSRRGSQISRPAPRETPVPFETILIQRHTPRGPNELPSFSVICLWISEGIMWLDNIWLALRHWSVNEPVIFTFALAVPGIILSLIGKYIPTTVFLYVVVMGLIVWPYIEYHSLRQRTYNYISLQYPGILRRARLMGPRRKISVAVNNYKSQRDASETTTNTERKTVTLKDEKDDSKSDKQPNMGNATRPKLMKQASTELTTAYREAVAKIELLEEQVAKEHQLRKVTDNYILDLQAARQEAVGCLDQVKAAQKDVTKHFASVKSTHSKLSDEIDCLRLLTTSSTIDPSQLHKLYSEIVSLGSKMALEFEALSRSINATKSSTDTLAFHLRGN